ncbi:TonB-dependent siderophore receptor [Burkholderia lata]|uniref:Ferric coprogen and ferric-rhodotorulic acid outer membrane receptor n=1 Tax=Burkholderia lata (strain ATCC 17760 / DSM 23089 / LMG 22485 / NCIMB 9086 / R18194 / 383) TaxID=482957 RepID=A0A6P2ZAY8_BURL3|nr:TonB-dependent siderophore receptor [Burkholderia lata]VWD32101.1 ferric coprogen and ferric-rhodotorulic acid outer membrane receptor [Burkholderia lata]
MKTTTDRSGAPRAPMTGWRLRAPCLTPLALAMLGIASPCVRAQVTPDTSGGVLPAVTVTAPASPDATTEGTGTYAAKRATIAGRTAERIKDIPRSVSVMTRQQMDDQNLTTIQEALRYVTGVTSVDYGDGTAYFRARGTQLGIEFDGVPIASGLQYKQQFDLAMYDRIEVQRGPAGVIDGAGEPGGTVNLVRKRPQDRFHLSTETQVGSFGSVRQMVDVTGPLNKDGSLRGRAVLVGSDGLESVERIRGKNVMAYGALDYDFSPRTTLSLSAAYQVSPVSGLDYGAAGVVNASMTALTGRVPSAYTQNFSPSWNYSYTSVQEVNGNLVHRFANDWTSSTTLFYRHELLKGYYAYAGPGSLPNGLAQYGDQRQRNAIDWFGADTNVSGPVRLFGQTHTLTFGANYTVMSTTAQSGYVRLKGPYGGAAGLFNLFDPNAVPAVDVPYTYGENDRTMQYGFYAQARIRVAKPLTLVLGGREVFVQTRSQTLLPTVQDWTTGAQIDHRFLPSAGLVWDIVPWLTAYANYSRFVTPQTETFYGGGGLPPRTGEQYEVGVKGSFLDGRLDATAALFRINDNNRAVGDPLHPNFSVAEGHVRDQGVELEVTGQPAPDWNVYAGYTYLDAGYDSGSDAYLTDGTDPKHLFKMSTKYTFSRGLLRGVSIGGGVLAQTRISRGVEQGAYAIFNAQIGYRFSKHVEASLQLNNVFNRDYYIRPPSRFYSVFGDKRNVMLTVRSDF